jgi:hypothetical protein
LAAMFTLSVATTTVNIAMPTSTRDEKFPTSPTDPKSRDESR